MKSRRGEGFERVLREFLRRYRCYEVGHGELFSIDATEAQRPTWSVPTNTMWR